MDASQKPGDGPDAGKINGETNAADAGASDATPRVESPSLVPGQSEPAEAEPVRAAEPPRPNPTSIIIAARGERRDRAEPDAPQPRRAVPRLAAAAVLLLAVCLGAAGTLGLQRALDDDGPATTGSVDETQALRQTVARINADLAALKSGADASTKSISAQLARLTERIDRAERAQAEPAARIAKMADAIDRLEKRLPAPAAAPAASPVAAPRSAGADVTGSIPSPPPAPAAKAPPPPPPVLPGWAVRDVYGDTALLEGRFGLLEVAPGDPLPGGGRVEAIRRDRGHWVVVTSRGLIVAR